MNLVIGINTLSSVKRSAYTNHLEFFYRLGRSTDHNVILCNPDRMSIDRMRNLSAQTALANKCEYLLFLDDDVIVPSDGLKKLISLNCDIAAGNVLIRGYPFENMFFTRQGKYISHDSFKQGDILDDLGAVGFSFCLIKCELLKLVPQPYFISTLTNTEDVYFCFKAREFKQDLSIRVDTSIVCSHILGDQVIDANNRSAYKNFIEELNPKNGKTNNEQYLNKVKEMFQDAKA